MGELPGAWMSGLGAAQPEHAMTAADLGTPFGKSAEWIRTRTGIQTLRRTSDPDDMPKLALRAAQHAVAAAGVDDEDIDLVIGASCSEVDTASVARQVAPRAGSMQVNAACSGFCYAVQAADGFIRTGLATHVLILAAEHMSRLIDPTDLGTSIIFGDGAGAAMISPAPARQFGIGPTVTGSDGAQAGLIAVADGSMRMLGRDVFRWAVTTVPAIAREACRRAGVALGDIDVFVPHQANLRIIDAVTRALRLEHAVVADDITVSGNTSAASVPIALTRLLDNRRAEPGQLALLVGFGAGLSYAAQVVALPQRAAAGPRPDRSQPTLQPL